MNIIGALVSLPVSIILIVWLNRCKRYDPFSKGNIRRLIIAGMLSALLATVVSLSIMVVMAISVIGIDTLRSWMTDPDPVAIQATIEKIRATSTFSYGKLFLNQLISIGLVEEMSRYLFLRLSTRKQPFAKTWLDYVICGGIVGIGFAIIEDLLYSEGGVILAALRALTPFHFTYGVIMGFFIGKAFDTNQKRYHLIGILIPVILHTLFDSSLQALSKEDVYLILVAFVSILTIVITIFMIIKINRWSIEALDHKQADNPIT
ncbi:MAG: PrsW family intramembrane metalloprotease [Erysipelotrichaceae bacterium]|nr:PrsW family intramembrane metalloprotease [Erysipelotrichaceae bacterium]